MHVSKGMEQEMRKIISGFAHYFIMTSFLQLTIDHKANPFAQVSSSVSYSGFAPLTFTVSADSQIWATGVIRPSHRLPHHSLNMTRVWWLSQQLRVMTALAPYLWSHLEFRLFSPMPFFSPLSPLLGVILSTQQHNSSYFSVTTHDECFVSVRQRSCRWGSRWLRNYGKNVCG